jgi:hypothetical protein
VTNITAASNVKEAQIQAVVIRADGTREDLGTISYFHKNPLRRWLWRLKEMLRG